MRLLLGVIRKRARDESPASKSHHPAKGNVLPAMCMYLTRQRTETTDISTPNKLLIRHSYRVGIWNMCGLIQDGKLQIVESKCKERIYTF